MKWLGILTASITAIPLLGLAAPPAAADVIDVLSQSFDDVTMLESSGWVQRNTSDDPGTGWMQGKPSNMVAQGGPEDSYAASSWHSTNADHGTVSNWLFTPELSLTNGSRFTFWTQQPSVSNYADRLQVRLSTQGASTEPDDFSVVLTEINPTLSNVGYPRTWRKYEVAIQGLTRPETGRIGLRHWVTDSGLHGLYGDYVGIDTVNYEAAPGVRGITPDRGYVGGATTVTVTGDRFRSGSKVTVAGAPCIGVDVVSASQLTCTTSASGAQTGHVEVVDPGGLVGSGGSFTYGSPGPLVSNVQALDFGAVTVGRVVQRSVRFTNSGVLDLTPTALRTPPGVSITQEGCIGVQLRAGDSCSVTASWSPTRTGSVTGRLAVESSDGAESLSVDVAGRGVVKQLARPTVKAAPKRVTVSWKSIRGADGYKVQLSGKSKLRQATTIRPKKTHARFRVTPVPGSTVKACVTVLTADGRSTPVCASAKVPK